MKTKIVLWGTNGKDEKILIAMELRPQDNKVDIWTFPEEIATEEFGKQLLNDWRNGTEVPFPEGYGHIERELTITDSLLPEDIKVVERGDIIQRAQTEWHFIVLSSKLNEVYQTELGELKDKVEQLTDFDGEVWNSLKDFWNKVQVQVRDRNLFREHANALRDNTNSLFTKLKDLRSALDDAFQKTSTETYDGFMSNLGDLEDRISKDQRLNSLFEELKELQRKFKDSKLTREHRSKVWERLDLAFKSIKEKRFGPGASNDSSPVDRLQRRYKGLINAIEKMEKSIQRDKDDLSFQSKKVASSDGQLEAQIRQAKIKMIEERIRSKEEKLGEMHATRTELDSKMDQLKAKESKIAELKKLDEAKKAAAQKIQAEIKEKEKLIDSDKVSKASKAITGAAVVTGVVANATNANANSSAPIANKVNKEDSLVEAVSTTMSETLEDVMDTVRAVAEVVSEKFEEKVTEVKSEINELTSTKSEEE